MNRVMQHTITIVVLVLTIFFVGSIIGSIRW